MQHAAHDEYYAAGRPASPPPPLAWEGMPYAPSGQPGSFLPPQTPQRLDLVAGAGGRPATVALVCGVLGFLAPIAAVLGLIAAAIGISRGGPAVGRAKVAGMVCVGALLFLGLRFQMGWIW